MRFQKGSQDGSMNVSPRPPTAGGGPVLRGTAGTPAAWGSAGQCRSPGGGGTRCKATAPPSCGPRPNRLHEQVTRPAMQLQKGKPITFQRQGFAPAVRPLIRFFPSSSPRPAAESPRPSPRPAPARRPPARTPVSCIPPSRRVPPSPRPRRRKTGVKPFPPSSRLAT